METNLCSYIPTGRMNSEKIMEDGNIATTKDDRNVPAPVGSYNGDRGSRLTANGHDSGEEPASLPPEAPRDEPAPKRINPLRIHLGKRPFVDNSPHHHPPSKKKKIAVNKQSDPPYLSQSVPRVPKLIPRRELHNASSQQDSVLESERDKPVPRLVPKSQLLQFQKDKAEKGSHIKHTAQNLGPQPMLNFKCRKCCTTFKALVLLKEHQRVCRAQAAPTADSAPAADSSNGAQSRVTRKVYLCSACGTYYENWNLFLHMREVHNRHICLFCLGMFSKAEKLSAHLTSKHRVKEVSYSSKQELCEVYDSSLYLMCCTCEEIYSEKDDFFNHDCDNVKPKPVPVLVKTAVKPNSAKQPPTKPPASVSDKRVSSETKLESLTSQFHKLPTDAETELFSNSSAETTRNPSSRPVPGTLDRSILKEALSIPPPSPDQSKPMHNGGDSGEESDESDSPRPDSPVVSAPAPVSAPADKEREGGIKLKLSLNNAKAPVIINSTVDPTVGIQHHSKPPSRNRKLPKRYDKDKLESPYTPTQSPYTPTQPRMPSIKMTICDKADNSFVKATIFEDTPIFDNTQDIKLKGLLNNNLEKIHKTTELKPDNRIKSTIYDNKIEDENSLNRVPKLTVRVPKELLDKDSSSDYSSDSDSGDKLTVDENITTPAVPDKPLVEEPSTMETDLQPAVIEPPAFLAEEPKEAEPLQPDNIVQTSEDNVEPTTETKPMEQDTTVETTVTEPPPAELPATELTLDRPIDKYPLKELLKVFLQCTIFNCIYCNHVRKIAVNCEQLCLHMAAEHRFRATVDSITAEELLPDTIAAKVRASAPQLREVFINLNSYDSEHKFDEVQNDYLFECFQCYFKTPVHKDLYSHNRKMHQKTILLCVMCKSNFYSYSELLCHLCLGAYDGAYEPRFRCCMCTLDGLPSAFRLMVHLRKQHHTCDVCLEPCGTQARLSSHVWKHKLHHLCYRCGIAYHNKPDITNHLFWKHGTQSVLCKRCLQKKWPHVYHFCTPPAIFVCDECGLKFTKAVYLKVHKRFHSNEFPHVCTEESCTEKFVSKKLLAKHLDDHRIKLLIDLTADKPASNDAADGDKPIPVIDLVNDKPTEAGSSDIKAEAGTEKISKKSKKKKLKDKDALLLDVNLPELNLSESDSSDESDSGAATASKESKPEVKEPIADVEKSEDITPGIKTGVDQTIEKLKTDEIQEQESEVVEQKPKILEGDASIVMAEKGDNIDSKANPVEKTIEFVPEKAAPILGKTDSVKAKADSVESKEKTTEEEVCHQERIGHVEIKSDLVEGKTVDTEKSSGEEKSDSLQNQTMEGNADLVKTDSNTAEARANSVESRTPLVEAKTDSLEAKADSVEAKANSVESRTQPVEAKTDSVEAKTDSLEAKADSVEAKANSVESRTQPVESKTDSVEAKADSVEAKVNSVESRTQPVEAKTDSVEAKTDSLEAKADSVEAKANSVESRTQPVEAKTDSVEAKTDSVEAKTDSLEAKADSVEAKANSVESRTQPVEAKTDSVEAKTDSVEAKTDSLEAKADSVEAKVNSVESRTQPVEAKTDSVEAKVNSVESRTQPVEAKTDSVEAKVNSVESRTQPVEAKTDSVEAKVNSVESRTQPVEAKTDSVEAKTDSVEAKADSVEAKTDSVEAKADSVEAKANSVESRTQPVEAKGDSVAAKADSVEAKTNTVEESTDTIEAMAKSVSAKTETVETKADSIELKADNVEAKAAQAKVETKADSIKETLDTGEANTVSAKVKIAPVDIKSPLSLRTFRKAKSSPMGTKPEPKEDNMDIADEEKQVLQIWDNFKKYQETVEKPAERLTMYDKPKEKTPPLALIKKHVCDSDHDYCLIPTDFNGEDSFNLDKKKNKKAGKKKHGGLSSSSSSSSDSDSSCSCGTNCSCSSSSGSSSSSSDSDSSDDSTAPRRKDRHHKKQGKRRVSTGSNVDVMGAAETPILIPEPVEPPVAETDLETDESDTDEEFYDEHPQKIANQLFAEKRNQLMMLASMAPSEIGSGSGEASEASRPITPPTLEPKLEIDLQDKPSSSKKRSKKKKKSKSSRKREPIKINIPKDVIAKSEIDTSLPTFVPNRITISLQSNTVQIPEAPTALVRTPTSMHFSAATSADNKRASKRRRVPNKFYGYSSDEEASQTTTELKPTLPPKLEWRKEDLPSPVSSRPRKVLPIPSTVLASRLLSSYGDMGRLTAPVPGPEPPRNLMSAESSDSDSSGSDDGGTGHAPAIPPPSYLMSGTSSLPYAFERPAVRQAREGESVYCYCRCPYDEVSEMIACDAEGCPIEWFHFECVGIMVPPKGKWYCPECRKNQSLSGYR